MGSRLDLSWDTIPHDGASAPVAMPATCDPAEYDDLFRAWCQERHENIESKLYLDEALCLLRRALAEGSVSSETRKRAKRLLAALKQTSRCNNNGEQPA
jgi:hypothetical protein